MIDIKHLIMSFGFGIAAISAIDVLGSITSRKWKYNYAYLTPLSIVVLRFNELFCAGAKVCGPYHSKH